MEIYRYLPGTKPIIISIPHAGTYVPADIQQRFTAKAKTLPDTDWYVDQLYAFASQLGFHLLVATHSRFVIDLNRSPDNQSLYPGKFTTGLCPTTLFDGTPVYQPHLELSAREAQERVKIFWQPYHDKLHETVSTLKQAGPVLVFDAHSIRSQVPALFPGILPDLNFGTVDGTSATPALLSTAMDYCKKSSYSLVANGRFKGGYITRYYGKPHENVQALQLEIAQKNYMDEDISQYNEGKAKSLQGLLQGLLLALTNSL